MHAAWNVSMSERFAGSRCSRCNTGSLNGPSCCSCCLLRFFSHGSGKSPLSIDTTCTWLEVLKYTVTAFGSVCYNYMDNAFCASILKVANLGIE